MLGTSDREIKGWERPLSSQSLGILLQDRTLDERWVSQAIPAEGCGEVAVLAPTLGYHRPLGVSGEPVLGSLGHTEARDDRFSLGHPRPLHVEEELRTDPGGA